MKKIPIYEGFEAAKRIELLSDNADGVESFSYSKPFTEEELIEKRAALSELVIEIKDINDAKKESNRGYAESLKPLAETLETLAHDVKYKTKQVTEDVYLIANREDGIMEYVNDDAEIVHSRRLSEKEKQLTIFSKASNE